MINQLTSFNLFTIFVELNRRIQTNMKNVNFKTMAGFMAVVFKMELVRKNEFTDY